MKSTFRINNADQMECTLTIAMNLAQFKLLRDQLEASKYPSFKLADAIRELVSKAETEFSTEQSQ